MYDVSHSTKTLETDKHTLKVYLEEEWHGVEGSKRARQMLNDIERELAVRKVRSHYTE